MLAYFQNLWWKHYCSCLKFISILIGPWFYSYDLCSVHVYIIVAVDTIKGHSSLGVGNSINR